MTEIGQIILELRREGRDLSADMMSDLRDRFGRLARRVLKERGAGPKP